MSRMRCTVPPLLPLLLAAMLAWIPGAPGQGYRPPAVSEPLFAGDEIALIEVDRRKLATNLAAYVAGAAAAAEGTAGLPPERARRLLGLALHLDPRNRAAFTVNFQLARGAAPPALEADFSPATLAEVLAGKGGALRARGGGGNLMLAGFLIAAAAEIDPDNLAAARALQDYVESVAPVDWIPVVGR